MSTRKDRRKDRRKETKRPKPDEPCYWHEFVTSFSGTTSVAASEETKTEEPVPFAEFEQLTSIKSSKAQPQGKAAATCNRQKCRRAKSCFVAPEQPRRYTTRVVTPDRAFQKIFNSCLVISRDNFERSNVKSCLTTPASVRKAKRKKKIVSFHSSTKSWDGHVQEDALLESLKLDFWQDQSHIERSSNAKTCLSTRSTPASASKLSARFHSSAKSWNGQREEDALLESLALDFWQDQSNVEASNAKSCLSTPASASKSKQNKSVLFHSSTKSWDGQRQEHALLERLALDFWQDESNITVLDDLLNDGNRGMLIKLRNLLIAAIESAEQNFNDKDLEQLPDDENRIRLKACDIPKSKLLLSNIHEIHDIMEMRHIFVFTI